MFSICWFFLYSGSVFFRSTSFGKRSGVPNLVLTSIPYVSKEFCSTDFFDPANRQKFTDTVNIISCETVFKRSRYGKEGIQAAFWTFPKIELWPRRYTQSIQEPFIGLEQDYKSPYYLFPFYRRALVCAVNCFQTKQSNDTEIYDLINATELPFDLPKRQLIQEEVGHLHLILQSMPKITKLEIGYIDDANMAELAYTIGNMAALTELSLHNISVIRVLSHPVLM